MVSILEFALFAWVGISIVAVFVQLIRIARYKRRNGAEVAMPNADSVGEAPTIDLQERLGTSGGATSSPGAPSIGQPSGAMSSTSMATAGAPATPDATANAAPPTIAAPPRAPAPEPGPLFPKAPPVAEPSSAPLADAVTAAPTPDPQPAQPAPTLADLLAGVRLPWNLLPTVDQSREPSNDRVVLITNEGEPADIGVDVADELERLGFTIAPRGDDTAIATRGNDTLGLQIIPDPQAAQVNGTLRFPQATENSVALDIWVE